MQRVGMNASPWCRRVTKEVAEMVRNRVAEDKFHYNDNGAKTMKKSLTKEEKRKKENSEVKVAESKIPKKSPSQRGH